MNTYGGGLFVHNLIRWFVLAGGLALLGVSVAGWMRDARWTRLDERLHAAFVGLVDLQFLAGLLLYAFFSPLPEAFYSDMATGMKVSQLRFFMLDHPVSMFIAISIIHVARTRSTRAAGGRARHRIVAISTGLALAIMLASIPWPGRQYGRPLFRLPGAVAGQSLLDTPIGHQPD